MMDYSAPGGIGEEGRSVVDSEAGRKITIHSPVDIHHVQQQCINIIQSKSLMKAVPSTTA